MPRLPGFVGPTAEHPSIVGSPDRLWNWIPVKVENPNAPAPYVFEPAPGLHAISSALNGECRGSLALNREGFFVMGTHVYQVDGDPTSPTVTDLFTIGGSGAASLAANGDGGHQIMATNGSSDLYWYDTNTTASAKITTVSGYVVVFLNGYFILLDVASSKIYASALMDGTSWDAGDVAQRNDLGDRWQAMIVRNQELLIFGSQSTSVYYNDPNADFPFVPNLNVTLPIGIGPFAFETLKLAQGSPIWLANDLTVRRLDGYTPVRISTDALEYVFSQCIANNAYAATWTERGRTLYALTLPYAYFDYLGRPTRVLADAAVIGATWVYDLSTGFWHEHGNHFTGTDGHGNAYDLFGTMGVAHAIMIPDSASGLAWPALAGGRFGIGGDADKKIYVVSQNYDTEQDGTTVMTRRRRAPVLMPDELKRAVYDRFELFMEVGIGADNATLQWSDNGGQTFNTGVTISTGSVGNFGTRVVWRRLGQAKKGRVFQVTTTATRLLDAFIEMRPGIS